MTTTHISLQADGTVWIDACEASAHELDAVLQRLGQARSQMHPPVAAGRITGELIHITDHPAFQLGLTAGGEVMLVLRHAGFGWLAFSLEPSRAAALRDALARRTGGVMGIDLDGQQPGGHA